jgi:glycosyltransferase involved in cell wall biosynthesis
MVPCYGYGRFLRQSVESVLAQKGVDVRVLIIDDASPDNTAEVAASLAAEDPRVSVRRHAVNAGHIDTYNEGLRWATAEYTFLLSADDMLTPGALARATGLMDAHPEVGLAYGPMIQARDPAFHQYVPPARYRTQVVPSRKWIAAVCATWENPVPSPTAVVRTCVQQRLGGYRHSLPHSGDMEMWIRFGMDGPVGIVHAMQAYYRVHENNMHFDYAGVAALRQHQEVFRVVFAEHGPRMANKARWMRQARRRMALSALRQAAEAFYRSDDQTGRAFADLAEEVDPSRPARGLVWRWIQGEHAARKRVGRLVKAVRKAAA